MFFIPQTEKVTVASKVTYMILKTLLFRHHQTQRPHMAIIAVDDSIKNCVTILTAHVHICDCSVIKTIHHAINITTTNVELFAIRYGINQAICISNIKRIIIVTDSIHTAKKFFDSLVHPYQIHLAAILHKLRDKKFDLTPIFSCKSLWDFSRKNKCNNILNR